MIATVFPYLKSNECQPLDVISQIRVPPKLMAKAMKWKKDGNLIVATGLFGQYRITPSDGGFTLSLSVPYQSPSPIRAKKHRGVRICCAMCLPSGQTTPTPLCGVV